MDYKQKLLDQRWQQKKSAIQIRDKFTCRKCGDKNSTVHVHHRQYIHGRDPWDYPDNLLVLLCAKCHEQEESCADVIKEMAYTLRYWGYFNTDIKDEINRLIELKIKEGKNG